MLLCVSHLGHPRVFSSVVLVQCTFSVAVDDDGGQKAPTVTTYCSRTMSTCPLRRGSTVANENFFFFFCRSQCTRLK